jgi:hypothetical protein
MNKATDQDAVMLVIRPEPKGSDHLGRDATYRLRILLKRMLRAYGWRVVEMRSKPPAAKPGAEEGKPA